MEGSALRQGYNAFRDESLVSAGITGMSQESMLKHLFPNPPDSPFGVAPFSPTGFNAQQMSIQESPIFQPTIEVELPVVEVTGTFEIFNNITLGERPIYAMEFLLLMPRSIHHNRVGLYEFSSFHLGFCKLLSHLTSYIMDTYVLYLI